MKKTISFLLPLSIIGSQYNVITGITFGDIYLLFVFLVYIFSYKSSKDVFRFKWLYLLWTIIIIGLLLNILIIGDLLFFEVISRTVRLIIYTGVGIIIIPAFLDFKSVIKSYMLIVIFSTVFLFIQVVVFYSTGVYINGVIKGIELINPFFQYKPVFINSSVLRPTSIFIEPGYYSQFVIPLFAYLLFKKQTLDATINKRKSIFIVLLLISGVLLSTSGQGIILIIIILLIKFVHLIFRQKFTLKNTLVFYTIALVFVIFLITNFEYLNTILLRLVISDDSTTGIRLLRGFQVYKELPIEHRVFGVGYGNIGYYMTINNITTNYDNFSQIEYFSSFTNLLVSVGFFGPIIYLISVLSPYNKRKNEQYVSVLIIIFIILILSTSIMISISSILYYYFIHSSNNKNTNFYKGSENHE